MTAWEAVLVAAVLLAIIWAVGGWRAWPPAGESRGGPTPEALPLRELVAALEALRPPVRRPEQMVTLRLMSGSGTRELGRRVVVARLRTPTVVADVAADGTRSVFQASRQEGDTWIYRRVGVEPGG